MTAGLSLGGPAATLIATIVFHGGGMPHGTYNIALVARAGRLGLYRVGLASGAYVAIVGETPVMCVMSQLVSLVLFVVVSSVHFGEDWMMIYQPLL